MTYIAIDKDYLESKIAELKKEESSFSKHINKSSIRGKLKAYKDILSQGIEVPVEELESFEDKQTQFYLKCWEHGKNNNMEEGVKNRLQKKQELFKEAYPHGVIIKPK